MKKNLGKNFYPNITSDMFDIQLFASSGETEKEKIEETDKMDDTEKADKLEAEAHKDKKEAESGNEESSEKSEKKEEKKESDDISAKEEAYKAEIAEMKSLIASLSKRLDIAEDRLVEVSANKAAEEDEESSDAGFITM